ncbi:MULTISPECIES: tyrosine-type recombinase/integrase [Nocardia]|uniref:tyrosine-type recombinase/integrase n=1 Tax=Nocardia TaxID=1817 RepID=UPI00135A8520|nr:MULTISPECIES: tyrosine-type recombinase/integrase [Nocardia]
MLRGWERQLLGGRRLAPRTVRGYLSPVRRFWGFTAEYPWHWTAAHFDEWMVDLVVVHRRRKSTLRAYQGAVQDFCAYVTSPHYGWIAECENRFGTHPVQICHEWNTAAHLVDYEGGPDRRPMTREEIQLLLDYADGQVEQAVRLGRKGALTAYRDATVFKVLYGWGLRAREASKLDSTDCYRNPAAPQLGRFGQLHVRWGKASKGSPPRRRMVASTMPWAVEALEDYMVNIRPRFTDRADGPMFLTERGGRLQPREIDARFADYRDTLGLPGDLVPHCLRHSYVTHSIEDGADARFVQEQVGHRFASTTAIYTAVSGDFMNTMMRRALERAFTTEQEQLR